MAIEVFQGASIPRELSSAAMEFLWAKWKALSATNSLSLQRMTEESSHPLRANSTYVLSTGDDFVYMYVGDAIQAAAGFNPTGQLLSASDRVVARDLLVGLPPGSQDARTLVRALHGRQQRRSDLAGIDPADPPRTGHRAPRRYSELVSHQTEVCEYLFKTSRDPMIVASPIANELGDVTDGWVVMMNDAARELLNFQAGISNLRLKHLPALQGIDLRFRLHPPVADGSVSRAASPEIDAEIIRFAHAVCAQAEPAGRPRAIEKAPALAPA